MTYTYYLLTLADGSQVTVPELPDFSSFEPAVGDDPRGADEGGDVDAKTIHFIPRLVVSWVER
jgi:hypothetical protein